MSEPITISSLIDVLMIAEREHGDLPVFVEVFASGTTDIGVEGNFYEHSMIEFVEDGQNFDQDGYPFEKPTRIVLGLCQMADRSSGELVDM
jgi:hypothetical protein